jgi:hypothetical protein
VSFVSRVHVVGVHRICRVNLNTVYAFFKHCVLWKWFQCQQPKVNEARVEYATSTCFTWNW